MYVRGCIKTIIGAALAVVTPSTSFRFRSVLQKTSIILFSSAKVAHLYESSKHFSEKLSYFYAI